MFASALSRNHSTASRADARSTTASARLGEVVGVGEEERRVVAVDDEAGHLLGVGVVVDVVHAGDVRHVAEDAVVRAGDAAQQVEHRQRDGRPDAGEHAEEQHRGGRRERQHELAAPEGRDPPQLRDVDEPDRGVDDDGAERRGREGGDDGARARAGSRRRGRGTTSECSWVRAPIVSAITVRLPLELIGKPWKRPVATLAAPSARNSWSLSMDSRCRAAKARPVSTLSE